MKNTNIGQLYFDPKGKRRIHGVYSTTLDRFILIDDCDPWMTLQTAQILSGKLPTLAYIIHTLDFDLNNQNCLNYSIRDKTNQTVRGVSLFNRRQTPLLKYLKRYKQQSQVIEAGPNVDYATPEREEILKKLQEYANFVHEVVYVLNYTDTITNAHSEQDFLDSYVTHEMVNSVNGQMKNKYDRSSDERGVFFMIKNALYVSETIEEAEAKITQIWLENYHEQEHLVEAFYYWWNRPVPPELAAHTELKFTNITPNIL